MSRQVYRLGLGIALVAMAFVLTEQLLRRPCVTEANIRRIREGMTARQVEDILGPPNVCQPFTQSPRNQSYLSLEDRHASVGRGRLVNWNWGTATSRHRVFILFDEDGRVSEVEAIFRDEPSPPSVLTSLRACLGL
jgi:outer membrane protein assembly factor BamE (lipoprotein component of BamABCDE complex)